MTRSSVFVFPVISTFPKRNFVPRSNRYVTSATGYSLRFSTAGETRACAYPSSFTRVVSASRSVRSTSRLKRSPLSSFTVFRSVSSGMPDSPEKRTSPMRYCRPSKIRIVTISPFFPRPTTGSEIFESRNPLFW